MELEIKEPKGRWRYHLLRRYTKLAFLLYYRRVEQVGIKDIPTEHANILAINHQNTLSDPLSVAAFVPFNPTFLTRADAFKNPMAARFLLWLKMLPIYRQRDGGDTLKKNEKIFDICISRLNQKQSILIFPEGSHEGKHRVRPLKKGLARIVLNAAKKSGFTLPIYIQPIGVNYTHYTKFQSDLNVWYGEPFDVSPYYNIYQQDEKQAIADLTHRVRKEIQKYTLHVSHVRHYDMINQLREWFVPDFVEKGKYPVLEGVKSGQRIISHVEKWIEDQEEEQHIDQLIQKVNEYARLLKNLDLRDHVVRKEPYFRTRLILLAPVLLLLLPLFLYGAVLNYLPYIQADAFPRKKMKDELFHSSIEIVISMILYPGWYLILFVLCWVIVGKFWIAGLFLISLPVSGLFAINYYKWVKKWWARWRFMGKKAAKDESVMRLIGLRKELQEFMQQVMKVKNSEKALKNAG